MSRQQSLPRTQTKALLLRTWHWQRRRRSDIFCTIILPGLLLILLTFLSRTITGRDIDSFPFQLQPAGAFAPRPFRPDRCVELVEDLGLEEGNRRCGADPFVPKNTIPFFTNPNSPIPPGQRIGTNGTGILGQFSLSPFLFPGALPGAQFAQVQTSYDGVFLHSFFDGNDTNPLYIAITEADRNNRVDIAYDTRTLQQESQSQLLDGIFNLWFQGVERRVSSAFTFDSISDTPSEFSVQATVFFNESQPSNCSRACPLVSNVARLDAAVYKELTGNNAMAYLRRMPPIDVETDLGLLQLAISIFLGLTTHFLFPTFLRFLVYERAARLRAMMSMMGLKRRQYWLGTYLSLFLLYTSALLILIIIGLVYRVPFFTKNSFVAYVVLFIIWGNVLIAFSMFLVPFFSNPETAQTVGWLYVILVNIVGGPFLGRVLSETDTSEGTWAAIMLLPSFAYLRSVYYAGAFNSGGQGLVLGSGLYRDVELGVCRGEGPFCRSYLFLALEWVFFMVFAAYFDRVLPSSLGSRLHPLFFLGFKRTAKTIGVEQDYGEDAPDVAEEAARAAAIVENIEQDNFDGVVLHKLAKIFPGKPPVPALKGLSIVARRNEVLCILGHNAAGKTTTFKTLVGELEASSGTAFVAGKSILNEMQEVHRSMGVAPQQDILWDLLSVREHLFFYGRVKGLSGAALKTAVNESLDSVELAFAAKRRVSTLSGGMKRRLSVSIAMIGDPAFIILDEPSTGLDLLAREKLWNSINRAKTNKAILLTTHSLDEAETLSNRVAIMSRGRLRCIGKAEELKLRLGGGHQLSVSLPIANVGALHDAVMNMAPGAQIETEIAGSVDYVLPKGLPIARVFEMMDRERDALRIRDWAIQQSTLEDVFLKVTKKTFEEDGIFEEAVRPDGTMQQDGRV